MIDCPWCRWLTLLLPMLPCVGLRSSTNHPLCYYSGGMVTALILDVTHRLPPLLMYSPYLIVWWLLVAMDYSWCYWWCV